MAGHARLEPSAWVTRWARLVPAGGSVLDVAAGSGRHAAWFAARGHAVTAIDRDAEALAPLRGRAAVVVADLEGAPWPLGNATFAGVVVTNYLWRPLLPTLVAAVAPGGALIYETFAAGNETVGRPANPAFLLAPGELIGAAAGLRIVAYEDGFLDDPARFVQRIAAVREPAEGSAPARHALRERPVRGG